MIPPIKQYRDPDRERDAWVRDVRARFDAIKIESRATFTWNSDDAPVDVLTTLSAAPVGVRVIDATDGTGTHVGGCAITWSWDGSTRRVRVSAIGTLTSSTTYTVVLGMVQ